jgi:hypothetical protein
MFFLAHDTLKSKTWQTKSYKLRFDMIINSWHAFACVDPLFEI